MPVVRISAAGNASLPGLLISAAILVALPGMARAQSVNYPEMESLFGEPVTTSVTGKPQRASEAPAALVIITRDDIRRSPANDIPGLIQAYAGIDMVRWTAGQSDVVIGGGVKPLNEKLLVLVNGHQVYLDSFGTTNWSGLGVPLEEIQQIEIVRGPNSALFGFNASSGVINIITINPLQTQQLVSTVEVGTRGDLRLSQSLAIKLNDRAGLRISGAYSQADELRGMSGFTVDPADRGGGPKGRSVAGELYLQPDGRTEAGLHASHSSNRQLELTQPLLIVGVDYRFTSVGGHISHDTGWGVVSARILRNWSDMVPGSPLNVRLHNKVFVAAADTVVRVGLSDTARFGLEYRVNEINVVPGYPGTTRYDVFAGSGMWEHELSDRLVITAAARLDHLKLKQEGEVSQPTIFTKQDYNRSLTAWSFNGALLWKMDQSNTLRITASRGIQAPPLFSFASHLVYNIPGVPFPFIYSGNPYIKPAVTSSGEIGLTHEFGSRGGRLELSAFYNNSTDLISLPSPQTPPRAAPPSYPLILIAWDNFGTFRAYGVTASLNGTSAPGLTWMLNYTWTKSRQHIQGNEDGRYLVPLALDRASPQHKVKAQLSYEHGPWLGTVAARYTSGVEQLGNVDTPFGPTLVLTDVAASIALDARIAVKLNKRLSFAVAGENLTGAASADLSPVPAERRLRATLQVRF